MDVSMDGLRRGLSNDFNDLLHVIEAEYKKFEKKPSEMLIKALDEVRQSIGVLNCIYDDDDPNFNEIHIALQWAEEFFDEEGEE